MTPEDLVELEAIKRLKYRYLRCLDQKHWDGIVDCFIDEATASYGGGAYELAGRDAILDFLTTSMGATTMLTSHRCSQPEIDLLDAETAAGTWALQDVVVLTDVDLTIRGAAFYTDRYVKSDGTWRIAHTGYLRTYEEIFPRASIEGLKLTAHFWDTDGRSRLG